MQMSGLLIGLCYNPVACDTTRPYLIELCRLIVLCLSSGQKTWLNCRRCESLKPYWLLDCFFIATLYVKLLVIFLLWDTPLCWQYEGQMYRQAHTLLCVMSLLHVQLADLQLDPSGSYNTNMCTWFPWNVPHLQKDQVPAPLDAGLCLSAAHRRSLSGKGVQARVTGVLPEVPANWINSSNNPNIFR